MRRTIILRDGHRQLRVTLELLPAPVDTVGVEIPGPPALPRELRETARPPARVVPMPSRRKECA